MKNIEYIQKNSIDIDLEEPKEEKEDKSENGNFGDFNEVI